MPANLLATDMLFPETPDKGKEREAIQNILDYLYMLKEQLNYSMYNIGVQNFNAAELSNLSSTIIEPVQVDVSGILISQSSLDGRVKRNEESILTLSQGFNEMYANVQNIDGKTKTLIATTDSLTSSLADAEGNISTLQQTNKSLTSRISTAEGNVSTLQQTAKTLTSQMTTANGNISTLQQTATSLTSQISSAKGDISTLQQTANSLTARIASAEGDIATLQVLPDAIVARLETVEGEISTLQQLPGSIVARVETVEGNMATLMLEVEGYTSQISSLNDGMSTLSQTVEGFSLTVSNMIDKAASAQFTAAGFSLSVVNDSGNTVAVIDKKGISIKNGGFTIYNSSNTAVFSLTSAGAITMKGSLTSGSSISGASISAGTITGAKIQTGTSGCYMYLADDRFLSMNNGLIDGVCIYSNGTASNITFASEGIPKAHIYYAPELDSMEILVDGKRLILGVKEEITMQGNIKIAGALYVNGQLIAGTPIL